MRRRLLVSTCLIALAAVLALGVPLGLVGTALLRERAGMRLERRADDVALVAARADALGQAVRPTDLRGHLRMGEALEVRAGARTTRVGTVPHGPVRRIVSGDRGPIRATFVVSASALGGDTGRVWALVAGLSLVAVATAVALASLQVRRLARPLEHLARRVEGVGRGDYDPGPLPGRLPEVAGLLDALTAADARIDDLVRREREFSANVSHQLRSPVTGLRLRVEELRELAESRDAAEEADAALRQVDRLMVTIAHLEGVARRLDAPAEPLQVGGLVASHVDEAGWLGRFAAAGRDLAVEVDAPGEAPVGVETLRQVLDVLLDNALRHGAGRTSVSLERADDRLRLEVADEGPTPTGDVFARGVGAGTGLGLHVARQLVRRDGGDVMLMPGRTTSFAVRLPAAPAATTGPSRSVARSAA